APRNSSSGGGSLRPACDVYHAGVVLDHVLAHGPTAQGGDSLAAAPVGVRENYYRNFKLLPTTTPTYNTAGHEINISNAVYCVSMSAGGGGVRVGGGG
ncbi:hypothetical protein, partial [Streptomyces sp. BE303]|uniref:hypothetical protein n=1 Tax=Streptomyces sp. BE303 TaxID=3002528 RepID=UPI002E75FE27